MFGLLNPGRQDHLYRRAYSRCCQHQRKRYGLPSLAFLSYESILLFLCGADAGRFSLDDLPAVTCCKLRRLPRDVTGEERDVARFCSSLGLLLAFIKISDDLRDRPHLLARLANWVLRNRFRETFDYFRRLDPAFQEHVDGIIAEHLELERRSEPAELSEYVKPTARAFGHVFSLMGLLPGMTPHRDFLKRLGEHVGSAIIAYDCAVDRDRDRQRGDYNPLPDGEEPLVAALALCRRHLRQAAQLCRQQFGEAAHSGRVLESVARRIPRTCVEPACKRLQRETRGRLERWGVVGKRSSVQLNSVLDVWIGIAGFAGVCVGAIVCMFISSKQSKQREMDRFEEAKAADLPPGEDEQKPPPEGTPDPTLATGAAEASKKKTSSSCCGDGDCGDVGCCVADSACNGADCSNIDCSGIDCSGCDGCGNCDCNCN